MMRSGNHHCGRSFKPIQAWLGRVKIATQRGSKGIVGTGAGVATAPAGTVVSKVVSWGLRAGEPEVAGRIGTTLVQGQTARDGRGKSVPGRALGLGRGSVPGPPTTIRPPWLP